MSIRKEIEKELSLENETTKETTLFEVREAERKERAVRLAKIMDNEDMLTLCEETGIGITDLLRPPKEV